MGTQRDVVIIGAGHNGLVTAFYLARGGRRPLVLERRSTVGGAAVTEELHPGFKYPSLAHVAPPLRSRIAADMKLERHGLRMLHSDVRSFAPTPDGHGLLVHGDPEQTASELAALSPKDAVRYVEFHRTLGRIADALGHLPTLTPPDIDRPSARDLIGILMAGRHLRGLGKRDIYRLLRWGPMAVADLASEWFEHDLLRAVLVARGVFGTFLGPWSAGTAAVLLQRAAADPHAVGTVAVPYGGMGAITRALASAARAAGAEIRTDSEVARIDVVHERAEGVTLTSGERIAARCVVSNADPKRTLLALVDPLHLNPDFLKRLLNYRSVGATAKVNLALSALPSFTALERRNAGNEAARALSGRIHIGPHVDYIERAFDDAKYGEMSQQPYLEALIPSTLDPSLAPEGNHVMSICVQYAPYQLKHGDWRSRRQELGEKVISTLATYAPNLPGKVLHAQVITPLDLEEDYGFTGGHIFHGEEALDQIFTMRPLLGWARYRTPIRRLYLCGAGTHPGGGLTGASGANAAREILKDPR